jgi:hypothetical protein
VLAVASDATRENSSRLEESVSVEDLSRALSMDSFLDPFDADFIDSFDSKLLFLRNVVLYISR